MLEYIEGTVVERSSDYIIIEKEGIGFKIYTPSEFSAIKTKVYLKVVFKEDSVTAFGFKTKEERDLFSELLSIPGIGIKHAFSILKKFCVDEFIEIVESGDFQRLTDVPGIGKKTAQRIILEMKGKLSFIENEMVDDITSALVNLGFERKDAIKAAVYAVKETKDLEEAIKKALQKLSEKR